MNVLVVDDKKSMRMLSYKAHRSSRRTDGAGESSGLQ